MEKCVKNGHLAVFAKFCQIHPQTKQLPWKANKTLINNSTSFFLRLIDSPNGLPKLKAVESTVSEIMEGGGGGG